MVTRYTLILTAVAAFGLGWSGNTSAGAAPSDPQPAQGERPRLVAQLGHSQLVVGVCFSPDGKQVLTGSADTTARLWDRATGKELRQFTGHAGPVESVACSPDGKQVLTGSDDKTARLWDSATGKELRQFTGHVSAVTSVAFSPDGKQVLTGSGDKTARLWDRATGKELRQFTGHLDWISSVTFSPDGKQVLTGSWDGTARLWDSATGKELHQFTGHLDWISSVTFSPDGKQVLTGSYDKTARLWDRATGKELRQFTGHADRIHSVTFSPDGKQVLTGSYDTTACLWDSATGKELRPFTGHASQIWSVAFSPDGKQVLTGSYDTTARLWDSATGKELRQFIGHADTVRSVAFSPDGKHVLTGSMDNTARLWDTATGKELRQFTGHTITVWSVAFSPDGKQVLTGSWDKTARLWDTATGKKLRRFTGHANSVTSVAFSPDGKQVLTGSWDGTARLWDSATGKELRQFTGHAGWVVSVAFSPDGEHVLTGSMDKTARLWDTATGKELRPFTGHADFVSSVAFSPDGKLVLTGSGDNTARLWDRATGKELRQFTGHADMIGSVAFSPDGKQVLTGSNDRTARLWDSATGKELRQFTGHMSAVTSVAFSPDGKQVLTGSSDSTARFWDAATGRELCQLVSFHDGSWAVVDPEGRYDAANGGDIEGLHWVVGNEPIDLSQLKARYYEPGLLAKKLGFNKEPLRQVEAFTNPRLYPELQLTEPTKDNPKVGITLSNRGGGIGRVVVLVNGKELTADARGPKADPNAPTLQLEVNLANDPRLKPGQENVIEVQVYNAEGYLRSRGMRRRFTPDGAAAADPPELYAVVAGISSYRGGALNLRYAAKDADDFALALRLAAERLFGADKVHITVLTTTQEGAAHQPTRTNLVEALKAAQKAKPGDLLVVYLAGHGINYGGADGDFYYLSCQAADGDLTDPAVRGQVAVSSRELTELIKLNPAQKQVLVLDTCASGKLIEKLTEKRDVPSSQVRALELVKDRTGMYILAGCASDAVSYEATRYTQGILTYSLLLGMRGAALKEDRVEVGRLFEFAADKVPELARDIGGIQRPVIATPTGGQPFPIGRLTAEDQARIPLQAVRPLVVRCSLQDEVKVRDNLGLSKRVNDRLRDASASGRSAKLVFIEAEEFPDAYGLARRYRVVGETVTVMLTLFRGTDEIAQFKVEGLKGDLDALAAKVVREAEQRLEGKEQSPRR